MCLTQQPEPDSYMYDETTFLYCLVNHRKSTQGIKTFACCTTYNVLKSNERFPVVYHSEIMCK